MEEKKHLDPSEIGPKHVDIEKILAAKKVKLPHWAVRLLERILHADEINSTIYRHRDKFGLDFVHAFLEGNGPEDLNARIEVVNPEYIPHEGYPIVAGNHPLGGPDGLALMAAVGRYRNDIQFPVNDFLLYLPGLAPLFVPIDKVNRNTANVNALENAFASENVLLYFPAGLCSRKQKGGQIRDLEWRDVRPAGQDDALHLRQADTLHHLRRPSLGQGVGADGQGPLLPAEGQPGRRVPPTRQIENIAPRHHRQA